MIKCRQLQFCGNFLARLAYAQDLVLLRLGSESSTQAASYSTEEGGQSYWMTHYCALSFC